MLFGGVIRARMLWIKYVFSIWNGNINYKRGIINIRKVYNKIGSYIAL